MDEHYKYKTKSLEYIREFNKVFFDEQSMQNQIIIELWNGIFNEVESRCVAICKENNENMLSEFFLDLLVQQQKSIVLRLFQHTEIGVNLQDDDSRMIISIFKQGRI